MNPVVLKIVIAAVQRQRLLLKTARYVGMLSETEYVGALAELEEHLKTLEALHAE